MAFLNSRSKMDARSSGEAGEVAVIWPSWAADTLRKLRGLGPILTLLVLFGLFAVIAPGFLSLTNVQVILEASVVPAIVAIGLTFVLVQGSIDLSIEGVTSLSNMIVAILVANNVTSFHLGLFAIIVAVLAGAACGLFSGVLYTILRMPSLIVTLGVWLITLGIATLLFPGVQPEILDQRILNLTLNKYLGLSESVYLTVILAFGAYIIERHTRFGRMLHAIGADEVVLRQVGLPIIGHKLGGFMISGGMAAIAGIILVTQLGVGDPDAGSGLLFPGIAACVIGGTLLSGGRGSVLNSVMGALILVTLRNGLVQVGTNPLLQTAVEGLVIIAAVAISTLHMRRKVRIVK